MVYTPSSSSPSKIASVIFKTDGGCLFDIAFSKRWDVFLDTYVPSLLGDSKLKRGRDFLPDFSNLHQCASTVCANWMPTEVKSPRQCARGQSVQHTWAARSKNVLCAACPLTAQGNSLEFSQIHSYNDLWRSEKLELNNSSNSEPMFETPCSIHLLIAHLKFLESWS